LFAATHPDKKLSITFRDLPRIFWQTEQFTLVEAWAGASRDPKSIGAGMHSNETQSSLVDRICLDDFQFRANWEGSSRLKQGKFHGNE